MIFRRLIFYSHMDKLSSPCDFPKRVKLRPIILIQPCHAFKFFLGVYTKTDGVIGYVYVCYWYLSLNMSCFSIEFWSCSDWCSIFCFILWMQFEYLHLNLYLMFVLVLLQLYCAHIFLLHKYILSQWNFVQPWPVECFSNIRIFECWYCFLCYWPFEYAD